MAGVAHAPGIGKQVVLIAELRWRLFRNSLRLPKVQLDLIGTILTALIGAIFALGGGLGLGTLTYLIVGRGKYDMLAFVFWAVFLSWQVLPVFLAAFSTDLDVKSLLRFPLRFPAFFLLSLSYGLFDPVALMGLIWLVCIGGGMVLARPEAAVWAIPLLLVFAAMNLLLNRVVFSWVEKLLARRRSREIFFVVFILAMFSIQFAGLAAERWEKQIELVGRRVLVYAGALPPGIVGLSAVAFLQGELGSAGLLAGALTLYTALFGYLLRRRLLRQYRGEELGESRAPERVQLDRSQTKLLGWELPGLSGPVAAVFEKEVRYLMRNGIMWVNLAAPLVGIVAMGLAAGQAKELSGMFSRMQDMVFPSAVAFMVMVSAQMAQNSLAFDGWGVQAYLTAPVTFRQVMLGKNLLHAAVILAQTVALWLLISIARRPPGMVIFLATLAALAYALLVNFAVGNLLSVHYPRPFDFGKFRQRQSGMTVLIGLGLQLVVFGIAGLVFSLSLLFELPWVALLVFLLLAVGAFVLYLWSLDVCTRTAQEKREVLVAELCRS